VTGVPTVGGFATPEWASDQLKEGDEIYLLFEEDGLKMLSLLDPYISTAAMAAAAYVQKARC
jgi:hypothetical protein